MAQRDFPHASIIEGVRFTAQVAVPNVVQGLFRRRRTAAAIAGKAGAEALAVSFMAGLRRSYDDGPVWIRVGKDEALLALGRDAIRHVLQGSPDPFAADPEPKRSGMRKFQPDALTISRGELWEDRRRFTEAVLDTGKPLHRLAGRFAEISVEEAERLPGELQWETWNEAVRRVTRRIILGESAAEDVQISRMLGELMDKANPPGGGSEELLERYTEKLGDYVDKGESGSLVGLFDQAPKTPHTRPAGQVTHWLFALGDTLAINSLRCLAALAVHDAERGRVLDELKGVNLKTAPAVGGLKWLEASLEDAMRLWPTTAMLSRETVREVGWDGVTVPEGTQVVIVNTFNHRDRETFDFADRFAPEEWISGGAAEDWSFNHFSHGPQGCPGADLALFVGKAMLGTVLRDHEVELKQPKLDPAKPMPHMLDFFELRFELY